MGYSAFICFTYKTSCSRITEPSWFFISKYLYSLALKFFTYILYIFGLHHFGFNFFVLYLLTPSQDQNAVKVQYRSRNIILYYLYWTSLQDGCKQPSPAMSCSFITWLLVLQACWHICSLQDLCFLLPHPNKMFKASLKKPDSYSLFPEAKYSRPFSQRHVRHHPWYPDQESYHEQQ